MAEVINSDVEHPRLSRSANVPRNSRCRYGQIRAPKRCIIEPKRSYRVRRNQRVESSKQDRNLPIGIDHASHLIAGDGNSVKTSDISVPGSITHSSTSEPLSPTEQLSEHKRPRPEHQHHVDNRLSSSAPACLRESGSPLDLFGQFRSVSSNGDRARNFICQQSLLDKEKLFYLLSQESHYHPNNAFLYYVNPDAEDKVDAALRNEAVHNLRFMHNAFFNLSTETFCKAVNLIDRFIVKVKVKPKYMACVATASYCAASKLCYGSSKERDDLPAPDQLVHITRCGGNAADLSRMEEILASKLCNDLDGVNSFDFLRAFMCTIVPEKEPLAEMSVETTDSLGTGKVGSTIRTKRAGSSSTSMQRTQLIKRLMNLLEISMCSLEVYRFRPVCLALGIMEHAEVKGLEKLAELCEVDWADVYDVATLVEELYKLYYRDPLPCTRRSMVWTLSRRTLFRIGYSSPTPLDTITEDSEPAQEEECLLPLLFEP